MIYTFFIFGGLWFWTLILAEFIFMSVYISGEKGAASTVSMIIFVIAMVCFGPDSIIPYIRDHPEIIIKWSFAYFLIAIVYSFVKFFLKLQSMKRAAMASRESGYNHPSIESFLSVSKSIPMWMAYWPVSLLWTFLTDPVYRFFKMVFRSIESVYRKMYDEILGGVIADSRESNKS